jgi:hypothetical protein
MSGKTGALRIAQVAKWLGWLVGAVGVGLSVAEIVSRTPAINSDSVGFFILGLGGFAISRVLAWVLEGFAKD